MYVACYMQNSKKNMHSIQLRLLILLTAWTERTPPVCWPFYSAVYEWLLSTWSLHTLLFWKWIMNVQLLHYYAQTAAMCALPTMSMFSIESAIRTQCTLFSGCFVLCSELSASPLGSQWDRELQMSSHRSSSYFWHFPISSSYIELDETVWESSPFGDGRELFDNGLKY